MLGERIKERRKAMGLTQAQLGDIVGVARSTVCSWEKNVFMPDIEMVRDIARALNTRAAYLLEYDDDDPVDYDATIDQEDVPLDILRASDGNSEWAVKSHRAVHEDGMREEALHHRALEKEYLDRYFSLDEHGKAVVDAVLRLEQERVEDERDRKRKSFTTTAAKHTFDDNKL